MSNSNKKVVVDVFKFLANEINEDNITNSHNEVNTRKHLTAKSLLLLDYLAKSI